MQLSVWHGSSCMTTEARSILFLDFDGVLHPVGASGMHFCCLPLLEAMLREPSHASVSIVISSTWRLAHPLARLRAFFSEDIRARIVGVTPALDDYDSEHERHEEINAWLQKAAVQRWAALDDDIEGFPAHRRKNVVFTSPEVGLCETDLASLRRLFT
jgi:hypothetical protein